MSSYESYVNGTTPLPNRNIVWPLYGTGLENLGKDGRPVEWDMPEIGPDELLARVDACGLCFSDIKVIRLGPEHPRIFGRDMAKDPVVLGHEVALTIVKVGENRRDDFAVGDRFVVQAEIFYRGENLAFGYALHGGLEQFVRLGPPILDGDDGCYLIPIPEGIGYSEAALAEPWACVMCAFRVEHRKHLAEGGVVAVVGGESCREGFRAGVLAQGPVPALIVTLNLPPGLESQLAVASQYGVPVKKLATEAELAQIARERGGIDDLVLLDPDADQVESLAELLADDGVLCLMIDKPLERPDADA